jgi:hypothetical protein
MVVGSLSMAENLCEKNVFVLPYDLALESELEFEPLLRPSMRTLSMVSCISNMHSRGGVSVTFAHFMKADGVSAPRGAPMALQLASLH